jgi:hypothetical protein
LILSPWFVKKKTNQTIEISIHIYIIYHSEINAKANIICVSFYFLAWIESWISMGIRRREIEKV